MNLYDLIKGKNNNQDIQAVVQNMDEPQTDLAMQNQVGSALDNSTPYQRFRNNLRNLQLFDRYENPTNEANTVTTDADGNTVLNSAVGTPVLKRGFLNDLARGAKENYNNGFNLSNWQDRENKGFGTRLGEAVGTFGRILNSPIGRGLITAGLIGATGGNGMQALTFGSQAAALNQQNVANDKMYRNALKDYGYDLDNLKGYVGKDAFNTVANNVYKNNALQVRQAIASQNDNTRRANMIMSGLRNGMITPEEAQTLMDSYGITINDLQNSNETQLLPYKQYAMQVAPQVALGNLGVAQGNLALAGARLGLAEDEFNWRKAKEEKNSVSEGEAIMSQLDELYNLYQNLPQNKVGKGGQKATAAAVGAANQYLGLRNDDVAAFEGVANMITTLAARKLAGENGVMTDRDFERAKKMVPSVYDSPQQAQAKMKALKKLFYANPNNIAKNSANLGGGNTNKDPLGIM